MVYKSLMCEKMKEPTFPQRRSSNGKKARLLHFEMRRKRTGGGGEVGRESSRKRSDKIPEVNFLLRK